MSDGVEAKREAEEAKRAKEAEERARREAELAAREQAKREAEGVKEVELYEGMIELAILPPVDPSRIRKLEEALRQVEDLRVVLISGSVDEGTKVIVSAGKPIPLIDILSGIPVVEQAVRKGNEIQVSLQP